MMFTISRTLAARKRDRRLASTAYYTVKNVLNPENVKKTVSKFSAMKPIRLQPQVPAKRAAVLVPLCMIDGKLGLLFTLRTAHLKTHRGQVSFPGGMQDVNDKNLTKTALRETREELGIPENDVEVWGTGNLIVTKGDACVMPVIGRFTKNFNIEPPGNVSIGEFDDGFRSY